MKFTLSWLKEHLTTDTTLDEILERLTMIGLEVEDVDRREGLTPFTIAHVVEASQHPDADRLKVLKVDAGDGQLQQVVCGAPNAKAGMKGVFARPGDYVPGTDMTLSVGAIRGVESHGMMLSERELELSDNHDGIITLPDDAPLGQSYAAWAGLNDPVIEINLTPNRSDCTGVYGIARDLAASGLGTLKDGKVASFQGEGACPVHVMLDFEKGQSLCPAFGLRLVENVKNGPSPDWLQKRLRAIGLRPINALVDITNYITFDHGRPLHVFDADKVKGPLVIRRAKTGETFKGLDEKDYMLDESMCVIADDKGVESLAGIMGGFETGCDETTVNVLIESALWEPDNIAATGRRLGIVTDARYRFERGVDPAFMVEGLDLATQMVLELCGGKASEKTIAGQVPQPETIIEFPLSEVKRLCGLDVRPHEVKAILTRLGFWMAGSADIVKVAVPSWRPDVTQKADLVEEVMRIIGVDHIPVTPSMGRDTVGATVLTPLQQRTGKARRLLAGRGMTEALTWSFISKEQAASFGGGDPRLELANPIASDLSHMRPSLFAGLLSAAAHNKRRGFADLALFEVGQIFADDTPEGQSMWACGVRLGTAGMALQGRHWSGAGPMVNVFDAKADALAILEQMGLDADKIQIQTTTPSYYHPGRSGTLQLGPKVLGTFGELHPLVAEQWGLKGAVVGFEINLQAIPEPKRKTTRAKPALDLSDLMPVNRDFAFVVKRDVSAFDVIRAARSADKKLIENVSLFDVYEGDKLDAGHKSLALEITIQPREKTLTEEDLEALSDRIIQTVRQKTGGTLR
jgi:phenylalanyl-tRNA synthetase beta chain